MAKPAANEKIGVTRGLFVLDAVAVGDVTGQYAGLEIPFQEIPQYSGHDQSLWRWIAVSTQPVRVDSADGFGQPMGGTIKVDGDPVHPMMGNLPAVRRGVTMELAA
ncbi:MAG: hypothetical protein WBL65_26890 [Bryobacteraceae bacterium]